jgi:hypothetical protein
LINALIDKRVIRNKGSLEGEKAELLRRKLESRARKEAREAEEADSHEVKPKKADKSHSGKTEDKSEEEQLDKDEIEEQRMEELAVKRDQMVTTSPLPGTTLGLVAFPLVPAREGTIYDTPGKINLFLFGPM